MWANLVCYSPYSTQPLITIRAECFSWSIRLAKRNRKPEARQDLKMPYFLIFINWVLGMTKHLYYILGDELQALKHDPASQLLLEPFRPEQDQNRGACQVMPGHKGSECPPHQWFSGDNCVPQGNWPNLETFSHYLKVFFHILIFWLCHTACMQDLSS